MKTYLLTATGVIFLSIIVSLLIPEGKMNKSIVFVMRMACILVLIQPIAGIFNIKSVTVNEPLYDYVYICKVYSENQSAQLEELLYKEFSEESDCSVVVIHDNGNFKVESVTVEVFSQEEEKISKIYAYLQDLNYINITVYAKSN